MKLWNFTHNVVGIHTYYFLALALLVVMGIALFMQRRKQKKRDEELEELKNGAAEQAAPQKDEAGEDKI